MMHPSKNLSWSRRVEDVFSVTCFCLSSKMSSGRVCKTSWRRSLANTPWGRLEEEILQTRLEDFLKKKSFKHALRTSWRRLRRLKSVTLKCYVFKTSWKTKNLCWYSFYSHILIEWYKSWNINYRSYRKS